MNQNSAAHDGPDGLELVESSGTPSSMRLSRSELDAAIDQAAQRESAVEGIRKTSKQRATGRHTSLRIGLSRGAIHISEVKKHNSIYYVASIGHKNVRAESPGQAAVRLLRDSLQPATEIPRPLTKELFRFPMAFETRLIDQTVRTVQQFLNRWTVKGGTSHRASARKPSSIRA